MLTSYYKNLTHFPGCQYLYGTVVWLLLYTFAHNVSTQSKQRLTKQNKGLPKQQPAGGAEFRAFCVFCVLRALTGLIYLGRRW